MLCILDIEHKLGRMALNQVKQHRLLKKAYSKKKLK